jgi:thiol-disulfide isomerase/thioredoxin
MVALQSYAMIVALMGMGQVPGVGETVLLDFTADWCGPCQGMKPVVHQLKAAGHPVRAVNIDRNRELAAKYRVTGIPCFVMLVDGQEVDREVGATSRERLTQMLAKARSQRPPPSQPILRAQSPDDGSAAIALPTRRGVAPAVEAQADNIAFHHPNSRRATPLRTRDPQVVDLRLGNSNNASSNNLEQRLIRASVRLKVEDPHGHSYGTGTIVDARQGEALVLTCGHLFRDSQGKGPITVHLEGGHGDREVPGTLISYDLKRDLAFVSIRPGGPVEAAQIAPAEQAVRMGERVLNVGCNNGDDATARRSHVTGIDKYLGPPNIEAAGMPVEGRSGGGLFNEQGQLIGVCYAADPAEDEGVYAGLASIHAELERLGLSGVCAEPAAAVSQTRPAPIESAPPAAQPPAMPRRMPGGILTAATGGASDLPARDSAAYTGGQAVRATPASQLSATERAALTEIAERAEEAEVICIIRPKNKPDAQSEIIVLNSASPAFIEQLSRQQQPSADRRHLTSHAVPKGAGPSAAAAGPWRGK